MKNEYCQRQSKLFDDLYDATVRTSGSDESVMVLKNKNYLFQRILFHLRNTECIQKGLQLQMKVC